MRSPVFSNYRHYTQVPYTVGDSQVLYGVGNSQGVNIFMTAKNLDYLWFSPEGN